MKTFDLKKNRLRKATAGGIIFLMTFAFLSQFENVFAFGSTFVANQTVPNSSPGLDNTQFAMTNTPVSNAPFSTQVNTITIGGNIEIGDMFSATLPGPITANFTATTTSPNDVAAGLNTAIQASSGYASQPFTSSVSGNVITLTAKTMGVGFTQTSSASNKTGIAEVVTFTPGTPTNGETLRVTINGINYDYPIVGSPSVSTVVSNLQSLISTNSTVGATQDGTKVTVTADVPGTPFSFYSSVLNGTSPYDNEDFIFPTSTTKNPGMSVAIYPSTSFSGGLASDSIWFAPAGTTSFASGSTMTLAIGSASSILAPTTPGVYKLFVVDTYGNVSNPSIATLTVTGGSGRHGRGENGNYNYGNNGGYGNDGYNENGGIGNHGNGGSYTHGNNYPIIQKPIYKRSHYRKPIFKKLVPKHSLIHR